MNYIEIFCLDNSELFKYESLNRGFRNDIYVKTNNSFYNITIYDIIRLQQDFEAWESGYGFFNIAPNIVIVKEVTFQNIRLTLEKLHLCNYFQNIKPITDHDIVKELHEI